ncbi:16S rRNA (cytosine(1402)-N(4))-methyltransferase RsmH [Hoeflea prorocentri]|uniref:Ribosomal RNA small subunit methyltransferase H n=1 Tax=Hoeflea prorocentri TaxID=1922333 RepID=A0A9X3ZFN9_9HYPH|nr:16S rRNA (cytosine(1402)-N(4))-methyltransferase RsmH [Hoeflea prorocentri]MCY6379902.1 16S rRNA (cytosine(1402)-N(4))-methyltransferase RsmH [Hoeflea prorocentri]MDA5397702.1 16S rRNA (cytosine(1402)-N(4))-methyltransferase RsmH [Hoeflea prorocentri]
MTTHSGGIEDGAGGGPVRHIPVLLNEVLSALMPGRGQVVLDGTFGAGGYSRAILERGADVIALDRDPQAIADGHALAEAFPGRLKLIRSRFSDLSAHAPQGGLDGIVLDVGVSSMQIDKADRGFSFQKDGPLDMRMSSTGPTASDVVNRFKVSDLTRIFGFLGEEKMAGRIARAIEAQRATKPFATTRDLAGLIEMIKPRRARDKIHPATQVFQALRIYINEELLELAGALFAAERTLKPGGRLVVVSFHSLEDRIVKRFFQDRFGKRGGSSRHLPEARQDPPSFEPIGKVVAASQAEAVENPRARSAKLRAGKRTTGASLPADMTLFGLPDLPVIAARGG